MSRWDVLFKFPREFRWIGTYFQIGKHVMQHFIRGNEAF